MLLLFNDLKFCEQKVDILNLSTLSIYRFLQQQNFIKWRELSVMLHVELGHVLSQDFTEFLKYVKYITEC